MIQLPNFYFTNVTRSRNFHYKHSFPVGDLGATGIAFDSSDHRQAEIMSTEALPWKRNYIQ